MSAGEALQNINGYEGLGVLEAALSLEDDPNVRLEVAEVIREGLTVREERQRSLIGAAIELAGAQDLTCARHEYVEDVSEVNNNPGTLMLTSLLAYEVAQRVTTGLEADDYHVEVSRREIRNPGDNNTVPPSAFGTTFDVYW